MFFRAVDSRSESVFRSFLRADCAAAPYFTDPPFGLPKVFDDPLKELPYSGVFRVSSARFNC